VVLIADKSLYDIWIRLDIDISSLENIEEKLGTILATNRTTDVVLKRIRRIRNMTSPKLMVWNAKVRKDNAEYLKILGKTPYDLSAIVADIESETNLMLRVLHKLDQGASLDDVDLIANARWIRQNTKFEPIIVTDDRDLLTCGHSLSSFFGLALGFLSSFEILRLVKLNKPFIRYCSYYALSTDLGNLDDAWSRQTLEREVSGVMKKARIACHPNLRRNDSILRIIRS